MVNKYLNEQVRVPYPVPRDEAWLVAAHGLSRGLAMASRRNLDVRVARIELLPEPFNGEAFNGKRFIVGISYVDYE